VSGETLTREFVLHKKRATALVVSRDAHSRTFALPLREITWRYLGARHVEGPRGVKLAVVEATLPTWLARKEGVL
jgi:hypothetical protein